MTVPLPEQSEINICYLELKNENKSVSILEVQPKKHYPLYAITVQNIFNASYTEFQRNFVSTPLSISQTVSQSISISSDE